MWGDLAVGVQNTLVLFGLSWAGGGVVGIALGVVSFLDKTIGAVVATLSIIFGSIPMIAILFWVHYPLQMLLDVVWPPLFTATVVLALLISVNLAELTRETLRKTDERYEEVAKVLAIKPLVYVRQILVPNSFGIALPRILFLVISTIHATMFASLIGFEETFRVIQRINAETLNPVQTYTIMACVYAALCIPIYWSAKVFERRIAADR
jgi:polar amino acid transport system permease protein